MTSLRQIESNRRNAQRRTGPKTQGGKQHSSQNAVRYGLTAETVIGPLEDPADYRAFEEAVTTAYDAETAVERELVLRLASLLYNAILTSRNRESFDGRVREELLETLFTQTGAGSPCSRELASRR